MSLWTFAHFFSFILYCQLALYVLYRQRRSSLNRACAGILLSFGLWSFGAIPRHGDTFSLETVMLLTDISALGWFTFSPFGLLFVMVFAGRSNLLKKRWFLPALFFPPLLFTLLQWVDGTFIHAYRKNTYGWDALWSTSPWITVFNLYYAVLMIIVIWRLIGVVGKSQRRARISQAKIILYTCLFPFVVSSLTNVIMPRFFGNYRYAAYGDLFTLTFAIGIVYAVVKYDFMITPAVAAEKILSTMGEALFLVKTDGTISTVNESAAGLLGHRQEKLVGEPLDIITSDGGGDLFTALKANSGFQGKNIDLHHRSGKTVPALLSAGPLYDEYGDLAGMVCIARDISELQTAEENHRTLVKMQERDEVCRWLHDCLGADLYNISLLAELSRGRADMDTSLTRQLEWISDTSKEALESIRNYLDFANNPNLTLSDLALRMEEYGRLLLQSKGIGFSCNWTFGGKDPLLTPLKGLSVFLIFKESVTNILKHAEAGQVRAFLENDEDSFRLRLEDDGVGYIPKVHSAADHRGITNITGWADKAGGNLTVSPAAGGGTVVSLNVPH